MRRTRTEVEHAIVAAAAHAWEGHAWQRMYEKLSIRSEQQLREHISATFWGVQTECFIATYDREIYYDRETNTLVILNYRSSGTCLVPRVGPRAFVRKYDDDIDRYEALGVDADEMPRIVSGGISALHPEI